MELEYERTLAKRPRRVLPLALMLGGAAGLAFGGITLALRADAQFWGAGLGVGAALFVAGLVILLIREPQREAIDTRLDEIRSRVPPCGQLERVRSSWEPPRLPVLASYAWAF